MTNQQYQETLEYLTRSPLHKSLVKVGEMFLFQNMDQKHDFQYGRVMPEGNWKKVGTFKALANKKCPATTMTWKAQGYGI